MHRFTFIMTAVALFAISCGDNIRPFSDRDASPGNVDAPTGADALVDGAASCVADTTTCDGADLVACDAGGNETRTTCVLGCEGASPAHCKVPVLSNLPIDTCATPASTDLLVAAGATRTIDTAADCDTIVAQAGNQPGICVLEFANVTIEATGTLVASGPNVLSIVATTSMTIDGVVDVAATSTASGPAGTTPQGAGGQPTAISAGGGGGGFRDAGGKGAVSSQVANGAGGTAGGAFGNAAMIPARGGAAGGDGGPQPQRVAHGGFGGGAVQLASCGTLTIGATGIVDATGGGGDGGNGSLEATLDPGGGGGGGSGGTIWIEGTSVAVAGGLFANGGGGGSGGAHGLAGTPGVDGNPGQHGQRSTAPAAGGPGVIIGAIVTGAGGGGGALGVPPTDGSTPTANTVESSGGGGGAAGRIRINVVAGTAEITGATISPAESTGTLATN